MKPGVISQSSSLDQIAKKLRLKWNLEEHLTQTGCITRSLETNCWTNDTDTKHKLPTNQINNWPRSRLKQSQTQAFHSHCMNCFD